MNADRDAWTTYAERHGLVRETSCFTTSNEVKKPEVKLQNKYHAIPVHVDGVRFDSKKEAARFLELRTWEKAGVIADLERQPRFPLHIHEIWRSQAPIVITTIGHYTADFRYLNLHTGEIVVEDVKCEATKTRDYRLRKAAAEAIHGFTVTEV